ncbi:hypothetical protein TD95_003119 [Thielaviopsis punctulata]|uniref:DUF221-domain-containing protein n=1 Tax=Thielaviopsis punctulata TaxID=72032 RepID=A0A0F4Z6Y2_9PEZI|nr:hypothetical protein TD95_003119 [Thielaviopsis punctulata]
MSSDDVDNTKPASLQGFITTLAAGSVVAGAYIVLFLFLRKSQHRWYVPRTYLGSLREFERTPSLPSGWLNWVGSFWKMPDTYVLRQQSLDSFLFLRFLKVCTAICFTGIILTWPVLFPVNATGGGHQQQLDILTMSNIDTGTKQGRYRYLAHALMAWVFYGFVMFLILRESIYYINLRQAYLLSPQNATRISSRTVLFTSVPKKYCDEEKLQLVFGDSAKNIWVVRDTKDVDEIVEKRNNVAMQLEKSEVKLLKLVNKARLKHAKSGRKDSTEGEKPLANGESASATSNVAEELIPRKDWPHHRTGKFGLIGKKVDSIPWCREELAKLIPEAESAQEAYKNRTTQPVGAAFIEFHSLADAEAASQSLIHHHALAMTPSVIGVRPDDVIWSNLGMPWWQRITRRYAVGAFLAAMIIFWAIPVAAVSSFAQVKFLMRRFSWLSFLDKVPSVIMGFITGLLPSIALAVLMSLVPVVIRLMAKFSGEPTQSRIELFTQNVYFAFQVVQVFLVVTISGSAWSLVGELANNPGSLLTIVSSSLPRASNFYINYFIIQGLTIASTTLAQATGFVLFQIFYRFLSGTPRALYTKWTTLSGMSFGQLLPVYANIAIISITYSVIAPLILFWSFAGIGLFYLAYRYNILFVTSANIDTGGLIYPRALKHLFVGIYLAEVCIIGLCAVAKAFPAMGVSIALLIFTILFQITVMSALEPLLYSLPQTLQAQEAQTLMANGDVEHAEAAPEEIQSIKRGNPVVRFLMPWKYDNYQYFRNMVMPHLFPMQEYTDEVEAKSYFPPAVNDEVPLLWIPQDIAGVSKHEIAASQGVIHMTDEGATLTEKGKIEWDSESSRPPIWDEKVFY